MTPTPPLLEAAGTRGPLGTGRLAAARRRPTRRAMVAVAILAAASLIVTIPLAQATGSGTGEPAPAPTITVHRTTTSGEDGSSAPETGTGGRGWQLVPDMSSAGG